MTLKSYLWGLRISTVILFIAWAVVVGNVDPEKSGLIGKVLFYLSLFLFLSGLFILILTWIRRKMEGDEMVFRQLGLNFREGILLAILVVGLLLLQSVKVLIWWDGLLVTAGIFLVELYFLSRK